MDDANPQDYSKKINQYMHAVSSNFPNATSYTNRGNQIDNPHYYMAATDPSGLEKVFEDIASSLVKKRDIQRMLKRDLSPMRRGMSPLTMNWVTTCKSTVLIPSYLVKKDLITP